MTDVTDQSRRPARAAVPGPGRPPGAGRSPSAAGRASRRPVPPVVTLLVLALALAAAPTTFALANASARNGWEDRIATDCASGDPAAAAPGDCVGVLSIPRLGADWRVPIIAQGRATGAVWVAGTTPPGQIGNCVLSGRRLGGGHPFAGLEQLAVGDEILITTASHSYTYVIDIAPSDLTVAQTDSWVLDPVPGNADLAPQQALLTLVTRQDLWPTADRSVGIAILHDVVAR
ncbi:MAG: class E sortase [Propionibacteriaceae bacterium]|nr:class E sortase [Propionibacteriaceae bacterium]